jgi:hypothetical protein
MASMGAKASSSGPTPRIAQLSPYALRYDDRHSGPIVHGAGVAGGQRAVRLLVGSKLRQILKVGLHRALVARLLRIGADGHDLAGEALARACGLRLEMRAQGKGILLRAADAEPSGQCFRRLNQGRNSAFLGRAGLEAREARQLIERARLGDAPRGR